MKKKPTDPACPCGGLPPGAAYRQCCQPYLEGTAVAPDAERLMRSRYTAFTLANAAYLLSTWHSSTRPEDLALDPPNAPHGTRWLGLTVHCHERSDANHAIVEFTARFREAGKAQRMHETSRFIQEGGQWFYVDGKVEGGAAG